MFLCSVLLFLANEVWTLNYFLDVNVALRDFFTSCFVVETQWYERWCISKSSLSFSVPFLMWHLKKVKIIVEICLNLIIKLTEFESWVCLSKVTSQSLLQLLYGRCFIHTTTENGVNWLILGFTNWDGLD